MSIIIIAGFFLEAFDSEESGIEDLCFSDGSSV